PHASHASLAHSRPPSRKPAPPPAEPTIDPARSSYLVLPPENRSEDRALYWLGEALAEAMEKTLQASGVDIATREERRDIEREEMGFSPLNVPTIATRLKEAEALKVDRIVFGWFTARQGTADVNGTVTLKVPDWAQ